MAEVYEAAGLALSWAQCFEAELVSIALYHGLARKTLRTRSDAFVFIEQQDRRPAKKLLKEVLSRVKLEPDLQPTFEEALDRRNAFVHRFFWDRLETCSSVEGRAEARAELRELTELFYSANKFASIVAELYLKQLDLPTEVRRRLKLGPITK
jgi:hypothetical protein